MAEGCETGGQGCNIDQRSFKTYFSNYLAATAILAPFTHDEIMPKLASSASAAVKTCTAGNSGTQCGMKWTTGQNDGSLGVGEQMSVLEVVQSNLVDLAPSWVSAVAGTGTSKGDFNAGGGAKDDPSTMATKPATTGDRVGAGILTALVLAAVICGTVTMIIA